MSEMTKIIDELIEIKDGYIKTLEYSIKLKDEYIRQLENKLKKEKENEIQDNK
tara:strand:+ start:174 stop:332 length:159 start_codon:yes stop_codon:yes gene_type:complete